MRNLLPIVGLIIVLSSCIPVQTNPLPQESVFDNGVQSGTAPFADFETYFEAMGRTDGAPVLMLHGIGGGSSLFQYRRNAPALARAGYRAFAIDLLGFGRSSRPATRVTQDLHVAQIADFIETTIQEPPIIIANGLSAAYSIRLAATRPELVEALVLIGPTGYRRLNREQDEARIRAFERFSGTLGEFLYQVLLADNWQEFFLLDAYASRDSLTPEVRSEFDRQLRVENAKWIVLSFISGNLDQDVRPFWPQVTQPTLIIWGEDATTTPPGDAEDFLQARPEVTLITISDAKLLPNEDQADMFNEVVLEFLSDR
jgi:pimeloyl-ACP methyl ester carboxylesterase